MDTGLVEGGSMPVLMFILWICLAVAQFAAFAAGMKDWFHIGVPGFVVVFLVLMFLGPLGGLVVAIAAFHGAVAVWGWSWWQAVMLIAPALVLQVITMGLSGVVGLFSNRRTSRTPS